MNNEYEDFEEFWHDLNNIPRRARLYYSVRRKVVAVLHSPKTARRKIKRFVQRGRRGWADEDVWSFDHYLSGVIAGGVRHLRKTGHAYLESVCTTCDDEAKHLDICDGIEQWNRMLEELAEGFELLAKDDYSNGLMPSGEDKVKIDRAFHLFQLHYSKLWD